MPWVGNILSFVLHSAFFSLFVPFLGFYHFLYYSGSGGWGGPVDVNLSQFVPAMFAIIDKYYILRDQHKLLS